MYVYQLCSASTYKYQFYCPMSLYGMLVQNNLSLVGHLTRVGIATYIGLDVANWSLIPIT